MLRAPGFCRLDQTRERLERERLGDVADDARLNDRARVDIHEPGGEDDGDAGKSQGDLIDEPHPIVARHAHVAEYERDFGTLEDADGGHGVRGISHLVSHDLDTAAEEIANAAIVVNDENEGRGAHDVGDLSCHGRRGAAIGRRYLRATNRHRECKTGRACEESACYNICVMKHTLLMAIAIVALAAPLRAQEVPVKDGPERRVEADEIDKYILEKKVFFLDVREPKELTDLGTLEGYHNIPLGQLEKRLGELPKDRLILTA